MVLHLGWAHEKKTFINLSSLIHALSKPKGIVVDLTTSIGINSIFFT